MLAGVHLQFSYLVTELELLHDLLIQLRLERVELLYLLVENLALEEEIFPRLLQLL